MDRFFFRKWFLYKIENSDYLGWALKEACGYYTEKELTHYCIVTEHEVVDILAMCEPEMECKMKKSFLNIDHILNISAETTFDMFKKCSLYTGQCDNKFFWLADDHEIDGISGKFKIGLCFRNNKLTRVEIFCIDEKIESENERYDKGNEILKILQKNYDLKYKSIENSLDQRNDYSSIIITF